MSWAFERCRAQIDLGAVADNVAALTALAGGAVVCAVVKADGYGHGAVPVALTALGAGATWLGVATTAEGVALREAGITAPVLLLAEPPPGEHAMAVEADLRPVLYTAAGIDAFAAAARAARRHEVPVHLKVDTGMHRSGCEATDAVDLARRIATLGPLRLEGLMTHLAVADEPDRPETGHQLARFDEVVDRLDDHGLRPALLHTANSAGLLAHPDARRDLVRPGIAVYGLAPSDALAHVVSLRPALSLHSRVSRVARVAAGEGVSYGLRWQAPGDTVVATVSIGYADGVRRDLGLAGVPVLVGGRRRPMVGVVTMDQLLVDCGPDADVGQGDEVVLLGRQGDEEVTAGEWAATMGSISYEVVTGIGPRVPRVHVR